MDWKTWYQEHLCPPQQAVRRIRSGDRVVVESASCQVLGAAAAVYLLPVLFLLGGYALAGGPGGAIGFALGLTPAVWMDRRRKGGRLLYTVSSFAGGSSGVSENS